MVESTKRRNGVRLIVLSVVGLASGLLANQAKAQVTNYYFDSNGSTTGLGAPTNGSTFNWDDTSTGGLWNTALAGTGTNSAWFGTSLQGNFPRFSGGASGTSYTVNVSNDEQMAGFFETVNGVNLTINAIGSGTLDFASGSQGILNGGSSSTMTINAPISGVGGIAPSNGGSIRLFGTNTFTGGTVLASSSTLVYFNNSASFSTGAITNNEAATSFAPLLATGGTTVTLPNNFIQGTNSGAGVNFAADANTPVISTGTWSMGAKNLNLRNNGTISSPLTLTGVISGSANLITSGANGGTITLKGANTYTGTTTVGATGATSTTLILGTSNTIASSSSLILAGGTLNTGGINQSMIATTLGLSATSTIDFGTGAGEVDFADSSSLTWTGTLNLLNFNSAVDSLRFGTGATGLTAAQLAKITFNGSGAGTATLNSNGFLTNGTGAATAPEPSALALLGMGISAAGIAVRKRRMAMASA